MGLGHFYVHQGPTPECEAWGEALTVGETGDGGRVVDIANTSVCTEKVTCEMGDFIN